jgi:ATP-dependent helicase/nuclease subunit B
VRVVDYKTSDKALDPLGKHLATLRTEDQDRPAWLRVMHRGKERRWIDLQLPLYRLALAEEFGLDLTAAYFNLPKAVGETGIALWDDPVGELQGAAETCAAGVAEAILREDFWPPVDHLSRYDDHGNKLFHHGISASVDETWIQAEVDDE